jgi:4-carboxymuconolactone decarboxylase
VTTSEEAQRNHDELFPDLVSTLAVNDPELIEVFDNFAFDEVLQYGDLDTRTRLMVQLAAMIAAQALGEYRVMVGAALTVGVSPTEVKEIVYQAVPYVGLAKVFDFLTPPTRCSPNGASSSRCRRSRRRPPGHAQRSGWRSRTG